MKIDFTYVVNLNTPDKEIISKIKQVPFPYSISYYVMPAVNGWEIIKKPSNSEYKFKVADWWKIDSNNTWWNREVTPGEVGCTLSHYQCIRSAYATGFTGILMLEEDFVPQGTFPTEEILNIIPKDASIIYLDRNRVWDSNLESRVNEHLTKVGYSYNTHAYIITRKGMKEILDSNILDNIIPLDEFYSAINGTSDREDTVKMFSNPKFQLYSFDGGYFKQSSSTHTTSLTEFPPIKELSESKNLIKISEKLKFPIKLPIQDDSNWDYWCERYIQPMFRKGEYKLLVDEPAPNVYTFPFFTKAFCDEIIELSEKYSWKKDRHEFYPTTDNLLEVLGMDKIYNKVINTLVRPLAIWAYELEGKSWNVLRDESFIIRYKFDEQSHLSLHHDHSNITTLVNLNPGDFKGGGTYFPKYKLNVNPTEMGVMTLHPGNITHKHGARQITEGTRYVIVSFIKSSSHV